MTDRTSDPMGPPPSSLCGAQTRSGARCGQLSMSNGRCYLHGGLSTGPRTAEGRARVRAAHTTHGQRGQEARRFRKMIRDLQAGARRLTELA